MISLGRQVLVKMDRNRNMIDIKLRAGQTTPQVHKNMFILHTVDYTNKFQYIVHYDEEGRAIALSPVTEQYLHIIKTNKEAQQRMLHQFNGRHLKVE